jgi:FKBP-type peptidyl-prolyl cis-trans isomerase SlpA
VDSTPRPGDTVTLHYRLACAGQEIVNTFADKPDRFVLGQGDIDPRLETLLMTLQPGQHAVFHLEAWQAFGDRDASLVHDLPRSDFPSQPPLSPGLNAEFPLPNGTVMHGTIVAVADDSVRVDFNHPLAGLPVDFEVELLAIQEASTP